MKLIESLKTLVTNALPARLVPDPARALYEAAEADFRERLAVLEYAMENSGWYRADADMEREFSRTGLATCVSFARIMFLKNPLISRGVKVQADYVFGQGVEFQANAPELQQVVDEFVNDPENQKELTSHPAMICKEWELQCSGSIFLVLFQNPKNGYVRVRSLPFEEMQEIVCNPEDKYDPWFYIRQYVVGNETRYRAYPDIAASRDRVSTSAIPNTFRDIDIRWDTPIYHIKSDMRSKFPVPEIYCSLDWARAYKSFLEDWTTIMKAYAKMAFQISKLKGQKGIGAAKSKLETSVTTSNTTETNPAPTAASYFLSAGDLQISAIKTAGATTSAEEGRPVQLMVSSGMGLPNTFFGDANQGNFATSKTLDRPTELKMLSRQKLWEYHFHNLLMWVAQQSAKSPSGRLRGYQREEIDPFTGKPATVIDLQSGDETVKADVSVLFPSILERNVTDRVRAVVNACTLFGKPLHNIIPDKRFIAGELLNALGVRNVKTWLDRFYPGGKGAEIPEPETEKLAKMGAKPAPGGGAEDPSGGG